MMVTSVPPARKCSGTVENLTADDVEDHVDLSGVLQLVGLEVQEGVRSQTERGVAVAGTASSDHHGPHLASTRVEVRDYELLSVECQHWGGYQ
jgi:hypothetical protein